MDPRAVLQRILDCLDDLGQDASDGGDLSEVDSASEALSHWFDKMGWCPEATSEEIAQLRQMADSYENTIAPDQFGEGSSPEVVAQRLRDIAEELELNQDEE